MYTFVYCKQSLTSMELMVIWLWTYVNNVLVARRITFNLLRLFLPFQCQEAVELYLKNVYHFLGVELMFNSFRTFCKHILVILYEFYREGLCALIYSNVYIILFASADKIKQLYDKLCCFHSTTYIENRFKRSNYCKFSTMSIDDTAIT